MMKKMCLLAFAALIFTNSQIIQTNILDGPNNKVVYGEDNQIHGKDNNVGGYDNTINGDTNRARGNDNQLIGEQNNVKGNHNLVEGNGNVVSGAGNIVLGGDASPAEKAVVQAVIQEKIAEILAHRQLQFYK